MIFRKTITRPSNTTAYAIGDVINENGSTTPIQLDFPSIAPNPYVLVSSLISSNESGTPSIDAYFYSTSFTIAADNAAFNPSDANAKDYFLGMISHVSWKAVTANKTSTAKPEAPFEITINDTSDSPFGKVFVVLVAASAYTPISGETITIVTTTTK